MSGEIVKFFTVLLITYVAILVSSLRWIRVAQREHYIPGTVALFAIRWWTFHIGNLLLLACFLGLAGLSYIHPFWGAGAALFLVFLPAGLTLRGRTSRLAWTPRLKRLMATVAGLYLLAGAAGSLGGPVGYSLFVFSGVLAPAVVDLALAITSPLEHRLSEKYIRQAVAKLEQVKPLVVALTGSYGKTTTKVYTGHLLQGSRRTFVTPGSFNNRLGIARAINESMPSNTEVFVAEIGTYGPGEIAEICGWLKPEVVGFLVVGPVHLERFGTLQEIARAKAEILNGAKTAVLNADDELVVEATKAHSAGLSRIVWYSCSDKTKEVFVEADGSSGELFIDGESIARFDAEKHIPQNVAAAAALAFAAGCSPQEIGRRLGDLPTIDHRREVATSAKGTLVIDDTYNSNPAGARKALELAGSLRKEGSRVVVVTPGMVELGDIQKEENARFARAVVEKGFELVVVGYTNRRALLEGAATAGAAPLTFDTRDEAVSWVKEHLGEGDVVLYENDLPDHYP